jgi:hypothetical protein
MFPTLRNLSAAFFYRSLPIPKERRPPEFVYVKSEFDDGPEPHRDTHMHVAITQWNVCWEAGHLRHALIGVGREVPESLRWLHRYKGENIFLVPRSTRHRYYAYAVLFHMLPARLVKKHGLPLLRAGLWPHYTEDFWRDAVLPIDFDNRLSRAFAEFIWGQVDSGSGYVAYSKDDPIRLLAHNLDFWLPYAHQVAEDRLRAFPRVEVSRADRAEASRRGRRIQVPDGTTVRRPLKGGEVWCGEGESREVRADLIKRADAGGRLQAILQAVRSNRVEDDFSARWSFAREDFERRLYNKRAKIKVRFVELNATVPVHGPESEVHEQLIWEDFLGVLNPKEREVTVLLRSGVTRVGDIAKELGYANHSPVSKALARIRRKAKHYFR